MSGAVPHGLDKKHLLFYTFFQPTKKNWKTWEAQNKDADAKTILQQNETDTVIQYHRIHSDVGKHGDDCDAISYKMSET